MNHVEKDKYIVYVIARSRASHACVRCPAHHVYAFCYYHDIFWPKRSDALDTRCFGSPISTSIPTLRKSPHWLLLADTGALSCFNFYPSPLRLSWNSHHIVLHCGVFYFCDIPLGWLVATSISRQESHKLRKMAQAINAVMLAHVAAAACGSPSPGLPYHPLSMMATPTSHQHYEHMMTWGECRLKWREAWDLVELLIKQEFW